MEYSHIKFTTRDYLYIGSNGFAQVGSPDFFEKNEVEMKYLMEYLPTNHPIPDEFTSICRYKEKWFRHDFGDYSEIVLIYNDCMLEDWEESESNKFDRFWEWFNSVESADLESNELTDKIKEAYLKTIDVTKGEHLSFSRA